MFYYKFLLIYMTIKIAFICLFVKLLLFSWIFIKFNVIWDNVSHNIYFVIVHYNFDKKPNFRFDFRWIKNLCALLIYF